LRFKAGDGNDNGFFYFYESNLCNSISQLEIAAIKYLSRRHKLGISRFRHLLVVPRRS